MASIVLSAAGAALGSSIPVIGPLFGSSFGQAIGGAVGGIVDDAIFGPSKLKGREGPRLADLSVQTSTYGKMIPVVYGNVRIAGNIIWSQPIKETATTTTSTAGGKGGGGRVTQSSTTYNYSVTLAIGICEGPIDEVQRVWADALQLDLSQGNYTIYKGVETQLPDSIIESFEGSGNVPAYRGMAYVVIEDFPLAAFGNRIPNFTFEVKKKALYPDFEGESVENMIKSMIMIPGSGEFVYDTITQYKVTGEQVGSEWAQSGNQERINQHNPYGIANAKYALDQLAETCPSVEWIGVVVTWFGDSLDAGTCIIKPGVEYQEGATTQPETWSVGSFDRSSARQITLIDDTPRYGGTPDDQSLLRYLDELSLRGYSIMLYPMIFMDVEDKPWRGHLTGSASDVASFFTKTNGYNAFINHYANIVAGKVQAFVIGSELIGLTKVTDSPGNYPAVNQLITLAGTVKAILGSGVKITYAADWSEYHHTDGGWYNLDPLWASSNIDVVGIDAYFPLTNAPQNGYDIDAVIEGWNSGEGYDFYYTDPSRTTQAPLSPEYAWKNIGWWWSNTHTNPDASTTAWTPESKPIWFTEYGFPSVDGSTNQPNVFYDPASSDGGLPRFSRGRVDFLAQRQGIAATEAQWQDSDMIERRFVWTWDARPYPYWPDLTSVWTDGGLWKYGHWVNGKLGLSGLAAIVADLCQRAGLTANNYDVSRLKGQVQGFVLTSQQSARSAIEQLMDGFFFDAVESGNVLKFIARGAGIAESITEDKLLPMGRDNNNHPRLALTRKQEQELPQKVNVLYINRLANYQPGTQISQRQVTESRLAESINLPIVFSDQQAKIVADVTLFSSWLSRTSYQFELPVEYAALEPTDILDVAAGNATHRIRLTSTRFSRPGRIQAKGVAEDISAYDFYTPPGESPPILAEAPAVSPTSMQWLDIPALPLDSFDRGALRVAGYGLDTGWTGGVLYRSDDNGSSYQRLLDFSAAAAVGTALEILPSAATTHFDDSSLITVNMVGSAELSSISELALLNGANLAVLGDEILQFQYAILQSPGKYLLGRLLRGRLGTEHAIASHAAGERFILLDGNVRKEEMPNSLLGLPRLYKPVSLGSTLGSVDAQSFTYTGVALKPYSPVHITGVRDGGGNLTINWVRRTRLGGPWLDGIDVPLNEQSEAYEIEIMNGLNVVQTLTSANSSASYGAAEQTTDFGSPQSSISVKIYQISAWVGRGYAAIAIV